MENIENVADGSLPPRVAGAQCPKKETVGR